MVRRKKTSEADALLALVAKWPWWVGVLLALLAYVVLHRMAAQPVAAPVPGQMAGFAIQSLWRAAAYFGQFILPTICLVGAAVSAWQGHQRKGLVAGVASSDTPDALNAMSWHQFEKLVGEGFRMRGYRVEENEGRGPDGGVDLVVTQNSAHGKLRYLVQCKQWRTSSVGVDVVRALYGVVSAQGAAGGFVFTSGYYTEEAIRFAKPLNLTLVDGRQLHKWLQQAHAGLGAAPLRRPVAQVAPPSTPAVFPPAPVPTTAPATAPACPLCAKTMVLRTAKRGASAGNGFWGCSGYPACRGTRAAS